MSATSRSRLRLDLKVEGKTVLDIVDYTPWWRLQSNQRVPKRVLLEMTRHLAAYSAAGISVLDALTMLATSTRHKGMRRVLLAIVQDVRNGDTLPQAARAHPTVFADYYIAMLEAAERTGNLASTFDALANSMERDSTARRAVKSALAYPAILIVVGTAAIVVLTTFVLPKFAVFFQDLNVPLPTATRVLLSGAAFMGIWGPSILLGLLVCVLLVLLVKRTARGRFAYDGMRLHLPIIGRLVRDISMERFCRVFGSLAAAGVPLVDALRLSGSSIGNAKYAHAVAVARDGVMRGRGLSDPMQETNIFPEQLIQVLRVGEQTGRLTEQLEHATKLYAHEVDFRLKSAMTMLEPAALLLVGGGVGFVAVALVSAMYGIYSTTYITG